MFEFMFQVVESVESEGKNMACLFLSYGTKIFKLVAFFPLNVLQTARLAQFTHGNCNKLRC